MTKVEVDRCSVVPSGLVKMALTTTSYDWPSCTASLDQAVSVPRLFVSVSSTWSNAGVDPSSSASSRLTTPQLLLSQVSEKESLN